MLRKIIGSVWKNTPRFLRMPLIRITQKKFTASAAAVVTNERGEVLLLDHIIRPYYNWGLPGGFLEYGEQPDEAIRRELFEETGLKLENVRLINVQTINRHIEMIFRASSDGKPEVKSLEITQAEWFEFEKMPEKLSPAQKSLIRQVLNSEI